MEIIVSDVGYVKPRTFWCNKWDRQAPGTVVQYYWISMSFVACAIVLWLREEDGTVLGNFDYGTYGKQKD